jgi:2',3'-cyclic-nucleotide 2'-phosphodiesterase (5'-nucleotidase family)
VTTHRRRLGAAAAIVCLAAGALGPPAAPAAPSQPLRLTIAFTGDVSGYLEPCG